MRVTVYQPTLFPRVYLLDRCYHSDMYVIMQQAQFTKNTGLTKIYMKGGILTLPVESGMVPCNEKRLIPLSSSELKKMGRQLKAWYPNASEHRVAHVTHMIKELPEVAPTLDIAGYLTMKIGLTRMSIKDQLLCYARETTYVEGNPSQWLVNICKERGASHYLCGEGASYMDLDLFKMEGVTIERQDYTPPQDGNLSWLHYYLSNTMKEAYYSMVRSGFDGVIT
jgi:hypothetical protein